MNVKELLEETKCAALVYDTFRDEIPPVVMKAIQEVHGNINQALTPCAWTWDEENKRWHTGCRAYHYSIFDKDETMGRIKFCPFCGHVIEEKK